MEGDVRWVDFRTRRAISEGEHRLDMAGARLSQAIAQTIIDMSRSPFDVTSVGSREELVGRAVNGLVTLEIIEMPEAESSLTPEQREHIYRNVYSVLEALHNDEVDSAVAESDRLLAAM